MSLTMPWQALEKWLFPPTCVLTGQPALKFDLAEEHLLQLKPLKQVCAGCGVTLPTAGTERCGQCLQGKYAFDQTIAGFAYEGVMQELILQLKFGGHLAASRLLFELFWALRHEELEGLEIDAVVPVPLHPKRLAERGFNQSLELAKALAKAMEKPLLPFAVERVKNTPPQAQLDAKARAKNLKGAFKADAQALQGTTRVLLVDDVMTTGSTLHQLAKMLKKQAKVEWVACGVVARR